LPIEKLKDQLETIAGEYQKAAAAFQNNDGVKKRLSAMAEVLSADLDDLEKIDLPGRGVAGSVELKEIYAPFVDAFEHLIKMAYEIKHLPARELFYELLSNFEKTFYFEKRSQGLLDFDDLQVKTLELLTSQKIKTNLFDYLMIDETQDTSAIQFQIFNKLKNKNNLFLSAIINNQFTVFAMLNPSSFWRLVKKQIL
jgi:ATP-dependent exoDNAse (exonuclease V) beta subunit